MPRRPHLPATSRSFLGAFFTLALITTTLTGCGADTSSQISISGSSTVMPIIATAAEDYRLMHSDTRLIVNAGGSGVGISQLGRGQIDIGMMSRDIRPKEYEQFADLDFTVHAIGRDAVIPVISSEIYDAGITSLKREQIAAIYRGEISNWRELGGPDKDILVIDKEASRGTRQVFMDYILGDKDAEAAGADLVLGSNNEEQTALTQSDSAIGMLSLAWLDDDVKGLSLKLETGGVAHPTLNHVVDGTFPIVRDLIVVTTQNSSPDALEFISFLKSDAGQNIVSKTGYIPLTASQLSN